MIASLSGRIAHKSPESVVVDVGGVGYEVIIPLSTFYMLPAMDEKVTLRVHTHLREDSIVLYGFLTQEEKDVFQLLIGVTGVGPRLARNILSGVAVADLVAAIGSSDRAKLGSIPGIGAKSAERLILELKDKMASLAASVAAPRHCGQARDALSTDVVSALENLGYRSAASEEAVDKAREQLGQGASFEPFLKEALRLLSRKK